MPAIIELSFLLFAFINSIHAEEPIIILEEKDFYTIKLPDEGDLCLISRYVGEQKLVLWNTSDVWSTNTTLPKDLKDQHVFVDRLNISSYMIHSLTHSDSGLYQVECWNNGTMTQSENISLTVCSGKHKRRRVQVNFGETVDLLCEGAADNLSIQWLKYHYGGQKEEKWTRVSTDSKKSLSDNEEDRLQVVKGTSTLRISNFNLEVFGPYTCLVMDKQRCIGSHPVAVVIQSEFIYRSAGEMAVLHCAVGNSNDDQPLHWINPSFKNIPLKSPQSSDSFSNFTEHQQNASSVNPEVNQNNSLFFSSLSVSDAGTYICMRSFSWTSYILVVCPEFGPPAIEHFSQGDVVTLGCNHSLGVPPFWFMKTDQVEGTIISQFYKQQSSISKNVRSKISMSVSNNSVVLSNTSAEDKGEYWCVVIDQNSQCLFTAKTLLIYREPFWVHITPYALRSLLLVIPCVVVLTVIHRTRRGEQLPEIKRVTLL